MFWKVFLAVIAAVVAIRLWDAYGFNAVIAAAVAWFALSMIYAVWYWYQGFMGRDQYPDPHGRYYDEWSKLPEDAGDYYPWLAKRLKAGALGSRPGGWPG